MLILKQVRTCDGKCCEENPRFPNKDHSDCIYRDASKGDRGCMLQSDPSLTPKSSEMLVDKMFKGWSPRKLFEETCMKWPQNIDLDTAFDGKTGGCCYQLVRDGG